MDKVNSVKSSDIKSMSFDGGVMKVTFRNGGCTYTYTDVPKATWIALKNRNSKRNLKDDSTDKYSVGKYFQKEVAGTYKVIGKDCGT